jgi:hypothetical protein
MRTTLDIPDETYRDLKILAIERGVTIRALVLEGVDWLRGKRQEKSVRFRIPVIASKRPGSLAIDNETIYDHIDFP